MIDRLHVLVVAGPDDARALEGALMGSGWEVDARQVDELSTLVSALADSAYDIVLSDYAMSGFDGLAALRLVRSIDRCLPFVFVSDPLGEGVAVEAMRAGADGYLPNTELERLERVVERALRDGDLRREQQQAEQRLKDNEERLRAMIESAVDAVVAIDERGTVLSFNPAAEQLFDYRSDQVVGRNVKLLMPEPYRSEHDGYLARYLVTGERRIIGIGREVVARRRDGTTFPAELSISEARVNGQPVFTGFMRDVSERKRLEAALVQQALHDPLTGLPNRTLFLDRLTHAIARATRHGLPVAVLFLDLDRFKMINDTFGHATGDKVLEEAGRRLAEHLRPSDTVARFGGDEFVVLCEDITGEAEAVAIADRLDAALRAPFTADDSEVFVSASVGIAVGHDLDPHLLLRNADTAMYRAKEAGKGRNEVFHDAMRSRSRRRLKIENDLHRALERQEFALFYQPEVDLRDGRTVGFEALLRWNHPERGLLGPDEFLTVAEETGLIVPIGTWVMSEACRQAAEWRRSTGRPVTIWINVSARELNSGSFVDGLSATLAEGGCAPDTIGVEITESVLMEDAPQTVATTEALRELGVRLSIDDFGTGYSSLSYLKRFTVDSVKIDRSFIEGLRGDDGEDRSIVTAIISLAASLRLSVVAEGVETAEQLQVLQELGCHTAQGYHLARPHPAEASQKFLPPWAAPITSAPDDGP